MKISRRSLLAGTFLMPASLFLVPKKTAAVSLAKNDQKTSVEMVWLIQGVGPEPVYEFAVASTENEALHILSMWPDPENWMARCFPKQLLSHGTDSVRFDPVMIHWKVDKIAGKTSIGRWKKTALGAKQTWSDFSGEVIYPLRRVSPMIFS